MSASNQEAALKPAEPRAGAARKKATMAILARAETGCRLTRDPADAARDEGTRRNEVTMGRRMGRSFFPPFLLKEMGAMPRRGARQ